MSFPLDRTKAYEASVPSTRPKIRPGVLIVSNGRGEDAVGMALARELEPLLSTTAYPLVGLGDAYQGIRVLDPRRVLPSGGFGFRSNIRGLIADVRGGVLRLWQEQRNTLRRQRGHHGLIVAVGDFYCLWMAAQAGRPVVLVATAKSEYGGPHEWLELAVMRKNAAVVFARDALTAEVLQKAGVSARYVGNTLMDTIHGEDTFKIDRARPTLVLLPGSRADAPANLALMLHLCEAVGKRAPVNILCALAPAVDLPTIQAAVEGAGWQMNAEVLRSGATEVRLTRAFGGAVRLADVVVGMAGSANEQAAGLGKPIVAFPGPGPQFTRVFLDLQKRMLGEALVATRTWQEGANAVGHLLQDPAERTRRGAIGRFRMGEPGAVNRIAQTILDLVAHPA